MDKEHNNPDEQADSSAAVPSKEKTPQRSHESGRRADEAVEDGGENSGSSGATGGLFEDLLGGTQLFEDKEVLRPSYTPEKLPHRESQIQEMANILVGALRGGTPSNILIYGKTGTGKTACAQYVARELESASRNYDVPCYVHYINCEVTDTQYRVLAQLANKFIDENQTAIEQELNESLHSDGAKGSEAHIEQLQSDLEDHEAVPMTGWPTDRVYEEFFNAVDYRERVAVIMLDEIDKLIEKSGDDILYNLSRINSDLDNSRVSILGISNDLKFTEFLDPRVQSSLGEEEIVFPPYDANQLRDILEQRAHAAYKPDVLSEGVIPLCAALAAQEHGDARRALDLLRTAGELASRESAEEITPGHVRDAQEKLELDRVVEVVRTLPSQSKYVLLSILLLGEYEDPPVTTGQVYNAYKRVCGEIDVSVLTQRRVTELISELDMLGIVNAVVVSKGRYGRTKEITPSVELDAIEHVLLPDTQFKSFESLLPTVQSTLDTDTGNDE